MYHRLRFCICIFIYVCVVLSSSSNDGCVLATWPFVHWSLPANSRSVRFTRYFGCGSTISSVLNDARECPYRMLEQLGVNRSDQAVRKDPFTVFGQFGGKVASYHQPTPLITYIIKPPPPWVGTPGYALFPGQGAPALACYVGNSGNSGLLLKSWFTLL